MIGKIADLSGIFAKYTMISETHRNHADEMRRYINLIESQAETVSVAVERYVGIGAKPADASPFPATFTFEVVSADEDTITAAIKAEIQKLTGYEPASFRWRWTSHQVESPNDQP